MRFSNFIKIDKPIASNWLQNFKEKLTRECVESVFQSLDSRLTLAVARILCLKSSKKYVDIKRKNKEEIERVHHNASAFIEKWKQIVNG